MSEAAAPKSLYEAYNKSAETVCENENVTCSTVEYEGHTFRIIFTKKKANKFTVISCIDNTVVWNEIPFNTYLSGFHRGDEVMIFKEKVEPVKDAFTVYVINGKPGMFKNLDDGIFRSANNPGGVKYVHVMSSKRFRTFEPFKINV